MMNPVAARCGIRENGTIMSSTPKAAREAARLRMAETGEKYTAALAAIRHGQAGFDFAWPGTLLITGATGSGKTVLLREIAAQALAAGREVHLAYRPRLAGGCYDWAIPGLHSVATDQAEAIQAAEQIARAESSAHHLRPSKPMLVIDDLHAMLDGGRRETLSGVVEHLTRFSGRCDVVIAARSAEADFGLPRVVRLDPTAGSASIDGRDVVVPHRDDAELAEIAGEPAVVADFAPVLVRLADRSTILVGPAGSGKTSALQAIASRARSRGRRVLEVDWSGTRASILRSLGDADAGDVIAIDGFHDPEDIAIRESLLALLDRGFRVVAASEERSSLPFDQIGHVRGGVIRLAGILPTRIPRG